LENPITKEIPVILIGILISLHLCGCEELFAPRFDPLDVDPKEFLKHTLNALEGTVVYEEGDTITASIAGTFSLNVKNLHDEVLSAEEGISIDFDLYPADDPALLARVHGNRNNLLNPFNSQGNMFMLDGNILTIHPDSSAKFLVQINHTRERFWKLRNAVWIPFVGVRVDSMRFIAKGSVRLFKQQRIPLLTDQIRFTISYLFRARGLRSVTRIDSLRGWVDSMGLVHVGWQTPFETNFVYGFRIQKSFFPTHSFATVPDGFVRDLGSPADTTSYEFIDYDATPGIRYYRLAQLEDFGLVQAEVRFSQAVRVEIP
jgi:hypothetical protein